MDAKEKDAMREQDGYGKMDDDGKKEYDEKMEKCGWKKSEDLTEDDLQKSLDALEDITKSDDPTSRKDALLKKAQEGELEKSEQDELFSLLGGSDTTEEPTLGEEIEKSMEENENLQKALDVSDYLRENTEELNKSLKKIAERVEDADSRRHEFNLILAKAVAKIGALTKSMAEKLEVVASQPVGKPKSQGVGALEKSFSGEKPQGEQLSKAVVLDTMEEMLEKSSVGGAIDGVDFVTAISQYESTNSMHPTVLNMVKKYRSTNAN